jgi:predicted Zn-dependent protease
MNRLFAVLIIGFIIFSGLLPSHAESVDLSKAEEERRMGHLFDLYMTESFVMLRDDKLYEKISDVVDKIATVTGTSDNKLRLRIINDKLPVASSFRGYVYVSTGMLDILENEAELASVIAHAIAHVIEKDQHQTYNDVLWKDRVANFTGYIMPLLVFSGLGGTAIAGGGIATAYTSTFEGILLIESGFYSMTSIAGGLTATDLREKRIILNRLVPHINLPVTKVGLSVMVFLGDLYGGYGKKEEIQADNLAMNYLDKAGYNPGSLVSVLRKLLKLRNNYVAGGYIYHLLLAKPGLEKRIDNADHVLKNHK